jgi:hypothetical protein
MLSILSVAFSPRKKKLQFDLNCDVIEICSIIQNKNKKKDLSALFLVIFLHGNKLTG